MAGQGFLPVSYTHLDVYKRQSESGAEFIKTSTGFAGGGATFEDVELMRKHCPPRMQVKEAGGISTLADAERFLELGASRLGTSRIVKLADVYKRQVEHGRGAGEEAGIHRLFPGGRLPIDVYKRQVQIYVSAGKVSKSKMVIFISYELNISVFAVARRCLVVEQIGKDHI